MELSLPTEFEKTALSFPSVVDKRLATVECAGEAKEMLHQASALEKYAKDIRANTATANAITFGKLKIVAKLGELMPATPRDQLKSKKLTSPTEVNFAPATIASYRKVTANQSRLPEYYAECGETEEMGIRGFLRFTNGHTVAAVGNSGEIEWYTPLEYVELARKVMGSIDVDPASSKVANRTIKASKFYSIDDDGLTKSWCGNVWLNPPYAAKEVNKFIDKLIVEYSEKRTKQAVLLVNNATDTGWFASVASQASIACFKTGRIAFINEVGEQVTGAAQGQVFLYFGKRLAAFKSVFGKIGWIARIEQ